MYKSCLKRTIDIALSAIGLVLLALPMLAVAAVVKLDSKGPVFFWQKRVGLHKNTFMMPKFRTMYIDTPANMPTHMLNDPQKWITRSGTWLRKFSLDELPQILNILAGQMSIIGPRPALWNQYDLIAERQIRRERHTPDHRLGADKRPRRTAYRGKAAYDGEYVKRMSFLFDCKCFFGTIACVLKKRVSSRAAPEHCRNYYQVENIGNEK